MRHGAPGPQERGWGGLGTMVGAKREALLLRGGCRHIKAGG